MKKIITYIFIFSFLMIGIKQVYAYDSYWTNPVKNKTSNITYTNDLTPRISYWYGKVNQHLDVASHTWQTDPDGYSGAIIDKFAYCQKFYPNTINVVEYKSESINSWKDMNNTNNYTSVRMSYHCVQSAPMTSVNVFSPKQGDVYKAGDKIIVNWASSNIPSNANLGIYMWSTNVTNNYEIIASTYVLNSGRGEIYVPNTAKSGKYKISVTSTPFGGNNSSEFTIVGLSSSCPFISQPAPGFCSTGKIEAIIDNNNCVTGYKCLVSSGTVISGISGPQTLNTNQTGTWIVKASNPNGGRLSYLVDWGDIYIPSVNNMNVIMQPSEQSGMFTHSYSQIGTYNPTFTVTSENTIRCITTPCPSNATSSSTSLSVKVGNPSDVQILRTLRIGTVGEDVKKLQIFLGIYADGVYGKNTALKVKAWQTLNNLKADGVFGYESRTRMGL